MHLSHRLFLALLASAILWAEHLSASAADVVWTNTSGGTWATAGNWSPNQVPGSADTAWITNNGTYTVTVNASATVNALKLGGTTGTQTLNLSSGTFTATSGGSGTYNGTLSLSGATLAGTGLLALAGPLNWSGGTISGWVQCNGGSLSGTSAFVYLTGGKLVNTGTLTDSLYNSLNTGGGSVISNLAGATLLFATNSGTVFGGYGGQGTIYNYGLVSKNGSSGTASIADTFYNFGTLEADSGILQMSYVGNYSGTNAANGTGILDFPGGTHNLNTGCWLAGNGIVRFSGGAINVNGPCYATASVAMTLTGGTLAGPGLLALAGPLNWSGGTISGWVQCNGGSLSGTSAFVYLTGGKLVNTGTLTDSLYNSLNTGGGSVISNLAGATLLFATNSGTVFGGYSGQGTIYNYGLVSKNGSSGTASIADTFNNFGTLEADSGILALAYAGNYGGTNTANGTGILDFPGGTHNLNTGCWLAGTGIVRFSGGTINVNGPCYATASVATTLTGGTLAGSGLLALAGPLSWSGGTISGWVRCNGGTISGRPTLSGGTLVNAGNLIDSADYDLATQNGSVISNLAGATLLFAANSGTIYGGYNAQGTIYNYGLVSKNGSSGTAGIADTFNNFGTLEADSGILQMSYVGNYGGTNAANGTGILDFPGGTHNLNTGCWLAGTGIVRFSGGTINVNGPCYGTASVATTLTYGTLAGSGLLALAGPLNWSGGTISGWVQCNGGTISGRPTLSGGTLVNAGNLIDSADYDLATQNGSVISNLAGATLLFAANSGTIYGGYNAQGTIYNYGLVSKNGSSGTAGIADAFYNFGTVEAALGTLAFSGAYVQSAGGTKLDGGNISISGSSFEIQGGGLSGSNTVTGSVDVGNAGAVNPGAPIGSLQVTGNYTNAGSLNIALGGTTPGTGFDVLTVGGAARIAGGTLNVSLTNGFMPSASMSFVFLNAASILGTFSTVHFPTNLGGLRMQLTYTSTSVTIGFSPLPYVSAGPTNQAVPAGGTVNLSVSATGTGPFGHQWLKDGRLLPGATAGTLTISAAGVTQSGAYSVVVTNGYGMAISLPALVTVSEPDLFGWGANNYGQLGDGTENSWPQPVVVRCGVVSVADGYGFSLHLRGDATLWAAGENSDGQLGDGTFLTRSNAVPVIGGTNVVAVAAGLNYTLFLKSDGTLWAMGRNSWNDFASGPGFQVSNAVPVTSISNVVAMAIGDLHELFLKADGTLWAMGANASGQLGNGTGVVPAGPTAVPGGTNVVAIAAGTDYSLFLKRDGTVWGMGYNAYGELGDGTLVNRSNAVAVIGGANVVAIAAGAYHSLFLKADGTLWAVGEDTMGELGDNNTANGLTIRSNAVAVIGGTNVVAMAAGDHDSWFVKADGTLWGMGDDEDGGLGDGDIYGGKVVPVALTNLAVANIVSSCQSGNAFATGSRVTGVSLPIVLSRPVWTQSGGAKMNFTNTPGLSFSILAATNVALPANAWTWLGTVSETPPGQFQFTDSSATNTPQRFYRARWP